jgi:photosystem II stability/assembly factor-like uncharacterized protein
MQRHIWFFIAIITLLGCNTQNSDKREGLPGLMKLEQKSAPFDHFYFQRAFPDEVVDFEAMSRSLKEAKAFARANYSKSGDNAWSELGPYNIGGRINCIAIHPTDPDIILAGSAGGGVFKTSDGGQTWVPLTDDLTYLPIGHIAFDPVNPSTIYVGTGDVNISGTVWIGNGLYKSTDDGDTWTNVGLVENRIISKIAINPENPSQIFVGTMGVPFERNNDRGLYRSNDGGESWEQILFVSDESGVIDLAINPDDPEVLYAVVWNRIRTSFESVASGDDAGIYKTTDSGDTWTELTTGLPDGPMSRIGIKLWGGDPDVVFAQYVGTDFQLAGIFKSTNAGGSFSEVNTSGIPFGALGGFGWYFGKIGVSPFDDNEISLLGVDMYTTFDGGTTWDMSTPPWWEYQVHADKHAIEYLGQDEILLATDGGIFRTTDGLQSWTRVDNIPNTQYYRVTTNPHEPTMVLAGAQDNGTTLGFTDLPEDEHIRFWGGDGFTPIADPVDPNLFYVTTQNGSFYYLFSDLETFSDWNFMNDGIDGEERVNWDAPIIMDPFDNTNLYTGTERIYKLQDAPYGTWEPISPVLVDPSSEFFNRRNITTISKSAAQEDLIYAGTSDSKVWVSQDDGDSWTSINTGLPEYYVTDIKASPFDPATVFVAFSGYREYDSTPHLYKSTDYGQNWEPITGNLAEMPINHVEIYNPLTYFIATDNGVYYTTDGGINWARLGNNMPYVVVLDLHIEPTQDILIAATFARSMYSYDLENFEIVSAQDNKEAESPFSIYPNPAQNTVRIDVSGRDWYSYAIFTVNGTQVKAGNFGDRSDALHEISVADLPNGTYIVSCYNKSGNKTGTEKLAINR